MDQKKDFEGRAETGCSADTIRKWLLFGSLLALGAIAALVLVLSFSFGRKLTSIKVTFVGEKEVGDIKVPLNPVDDHLPDYRMEITTKRKGLWNFLTPKHICGPIPNTSAQETIEFQFAGDLSAREVQQIDLYDEDAVKDELATSVQVAGTKIKSDGYELELVSGFSFAFGWKKVWDGEFGIMMGLAIIVAILALAGALLEMVFTVIVVTPFHLLGLLLGGRKEPGDTEEQP